MREGFRMVRYAHNKEHTYCIDVVTQVPAATKALETVAIARLVLS